MTDQLPPRELSPQEAHEENERAYDAESRYWAGVDRGDRHAPAPDCVWVCPTHGPHRFILGCEKCRAKGWTA